MSPPEQATTESQDALRDEIEALEARLRSARARLQATPSAAASDLALHVPAAAKAPSSLHFLLLLADSALPLGAFAFSSGLESYRAHAASHATLTTFLPLSLSSFAATMLPFVLAAHRDPETVQYLDDALDASIICAVGRRASIAQGRALVGVWDRSFRPVLPRTAAAAPVCLALRRFAALLREGSGDEVPQVSAHLPPLFGAVCAAVGLSLRQTAYVFLLSHVKALVSAAVRVGLLGPYQANMVLAGEQIQNMIEVVIDREWETPVEEAGQNVPVMDLWIGRHELLYSRIFNS